MRKIFRIASKKMREIARSASAISCRGWGRSHSLSKLDFDFPGQFLRQFVAVISRHLDDLDVASTLDLIDKAVALFGNSCKEVCALGQEFRDPDSELTRYKLHLPDLVDDI